jgi:hypothetical protein
MKGDGSLCELFCSIQNIEQEREREERKEREERIEKLKIESSRRRHSSLYTSLIT